MDVILRHPRHVEIHHVRKRLDVDAASRDVSRHENLVAAVLETGQRVGALGLTAISVDAGDADFVALELLEHAISAMLRARENDRVLDLAPFQQRLQQRQFQILRYGKDRLRDARGGRGLALD